MDIFRFRDNCRRLFEKIVSSEIIKKDSLYYRMLEILSALSLRIKLSQIKTILFNNS